MRYIAASSVASQQKFDEWLIAGLSRISKNLHYLSALFNEAGQTITKLNGRMLDFGCDSPKYHISLEIGDSVTLMYFKWGTLHTKEWAVVTIVNLRDRVLKGTSKKVNCKL